MPEALVETEFKGNHIGPKPCWIKVSGKVSLGTSGIGRDLMITPEGASEAVPALWTFTQMAIEQGGFETKKHLDHPTEGLHVISVEVFAPKVDQSGKDISVKSGSWYFRDAKAAWAAVDAWMEQTAYSCRVTTLATKDGPNPQPGKFDGIIDLAKFFFGSRW